MIRYPITNLLILIVNFVIMERRRSHKIYIERKLYRASEYKKVYRFNEENVEWMAKHFLGNYTETRGGAFSNKQKMEIFLRSLADPGFQLSTGLVVGCTQSSVSKVIKQIVGRIVEKKVWIKFPTSRDKLNAAMEAWSLTTYYSKTR